MAGDARIPSMPFGAIEWLDNARREAQSIAKALPVPERSSHLWRYSDPEDFMPGPGVKIVEADVSVEAEAGVDTMSLIEAAAKHPQLVSESLGRLVPSSQGKIEALNAMGWCAGAFVRVPRGKRCGAPIRISTAVDSVDGVENRLNAVRNLVLLEEESAATIVEDASGEGGKSVKRIEVTEVFAGVGSEARLVSLQRIGREGVLHRTQRVRLGREARASIVMASFGGGTYKADVGALLDGEGAECRMIGLCFGDGKQHADHHTLQDHRAPHTQSDIDFRAVLGGRARSAYTGLIRIAREAPYCEAYQENRNLLLSGNAKAESIPELEILTDEVRCKHGATVGPIDPEQLFYLQSRGLTPDDATRMIVTGFLEQTLAQMPEDLREPIREELGRRLAEVVRR